MTPAVETPTVTSANFEDLVREMIVRLGEDPSREGLAETPGRVHRAYEFLLKGYKEDAEQMLKNGTAYRCYCTKAELDDYLAGLLLLADRRENVAGPGQAQHQGVGIAHSVARRLLDLLRRNRLRPKVEGRRRFDHDIGIRSILVNRAAHLLGLVPHPCVDDPLVETPHGTIGTEAVP